MVITGDDDPTVPTQVLKLLPQLSLKGGPHFLSLSVTLLAGTRQQFGFACKTSSSRANNPCHRTSSYGRPDEGFLEKIFRRRVVSRGSMYSLYVMRAWSVFYRVQQPVHPACSCRRTAADSRRSEVAHCLSFLVKPFVAPPPPPLFCFATISVLNLARSV